jgi:chemotaxis protein histidine kinase CheA/ActR/RegA family two-component response regulator
MKLKSIESAEHDSWFADGNVLRHPADLDGDAVEGGTQVVLMTPDAAQEVESEVLALLVTELISAQERMAEAVIAATSDTGSAATALEAYTAEIDLLATVAQTAGLPALKSVLDKLLECVGTVSSGMLSTEQAEVLSLFPGLMLVYLQTPSDPSVCQGMTDLLQSLAWERPLSASEAMALAHRLGAVKVQKGATGHTPRQTVATAADVSLNIPTDIHPELLSSLLQELPRQIADFATAIQRLATGQGQVTDIEIAKRAAHTLKGAAHTVGVRGIANLTHHLEDILLACGDSGAFPGAAASAMLIGASDCLEAMSEAVTGVGPEPEDALAVLQSVLDWANRVDAEGVGVILGDDARQVSNHPASPANTGESVTETAPEPASSPALALEAPAPMIWVPASLVDELLRLAGESIISTGQIRDRVQKVTSQNNVLHNQNSAFLQLASELEQLVDIGLPAVRRSGDPNAHFDPLEFEHYSELHTVSRRIIESAHDAREMAGELGNDLGHLKELVEVQGRLQLESQTTVLQTRMVRVSTVVPRLQRSMRQVCRLLDKQVDLDIVGAETLIDANILNDLMDPLMHMLRNAVDHGIEAAAVRSALGKNPCGQIGLSFSREGNLLVISCRDDGAGLDLERIQRAALERGMLGTEVKLSDDELARLILAPGFSTRDETTQVSGRGIGMDVVNSHILNMQGSLVLRSARGQGLLVELRVPATIISTHALLVALGPHNVALSTHGIEDIQYASPDRLKILGGEKVYQSDDDIHSLVDLDAILYLPNRRRRSRDGGGLILLMVRLESGALKAVQVQEIVDSRTLVIKKLNKYVPRIAGVIGATILGDGNVSPVIDLPELLRAPVAAGVEQGFVASSTEPVKKRSELSALVVDDSLSARRAAAQLMKDAGYEVRTAIDGMEAMTILAKWRPSIILADMEMPRMSGLELTTHVRSQAETASMPIIMITSRSTGKHRQMARGVGVDVYLTKPFRDNELLDHATRLVRARHG